MSHRPAELRSIELHRAIARRIVEDPAVIDRARDRVGDWLANGGPVDSERARRWQILLAGPFDELLAMMVDDSEPAADLRQVTPFAGVLDSRERWQILRDVG